MTRPADSRAPGRLAGLLLGAALLPASVLALDADREQPISIEADQASLNDKTGLSVYTGNVRLQQGTLIFTGNRMTVQLTDKKLDTIILTGTPATYVQRPEGKPHDQHAEAGVIEYYAIDERVILLDNARIWETGTEEFRSDRIVFNLKSDTVEAGGGGDSGRGHITIQPRDKDDRNTQGDSKKEPDATIPDEQRP